MRFFKSKFNTSDLIILLLCNLQLKCPKCNTRYNGIPVLLYFTSVNTVNKIMIFSIILWFFMYTSRHNKCVNPPLFEGLGLGIGLYFLIGSIFYINDIVFLTLRQMYQKLTGIQKLTYSISLLNNKVSCIAQSVTMKLKKPWLKILF